MTLILSQLGVTPAYELVARILETEADNNEIAVIDANKSEADIMLKEEWQDFKE